MVKLAYNEDAEKFYVSHSSQIGGRCVLIDWPLIVNPPPLGHEGGLEKEDAEAVWIST